MLYKKESTKDLENNSGHFQKENFFLLDLHNTIGKAIKERILDELKTLPEYLFYALFFTHKMFLIWTKFFFLGFFCNFNNS